MSAKKSSRNIKGNKNKPAKRAKGRASNTPKKVVVTTPSPAKKPAAPEKPIARPRPSEPSKESTDISLAFSRMNYILLAIGVGIIILGFFLMSLDDFVDATKFSISLYIAPIVVMAGFAEIIFAIMYTPKNTPAAQDSSS